MKKGINLAGAAVAFLAGALCLTRLSALPTAWWLLAVVLVVPAARWRIGRYLLVVALGFAWAWWSSHSALQHRLPASLNKVDLYVTGVVQPFPEREGHLEKLTLRVTDFTAPEPVETPPDKVRLSWYWPDALPRAGETWRFEVRLKQPNGFQNPGGFDYEKWLFRNDIGATGYVRHHHAKRLQDASHGSWLVRLRRRLAAVVDRALPDNRYAGILKGVTVGDGHAIAQSQWGVFRRTGIMHLVVISGSHIILVAGFIGLLISFLWRRSARLCERLAARRAAVAGGFIVAVLYALIAGFGVPVQRALIMFAIGAIAIWQGRSLQPFSVLAVALIGVLALDPLAPLAPGFWLSFGAVAILVYIFSGRPRRGWLYNILWAQVAVSISLMPLLALFFGQASLVGPVANWIAIPVFEIAVVPLALVGVVVGMVWLPAGAVILGAAATCLGWLWPLMVWLADWPLAQVHFASPPVWAAGLATVGVVLLLAPRGFPARWLGAVMIVPVLFTPTIRPPSGVVDFTLLDVGQGLSAVVQTRSHTLVFDAGPAFGSGADAGAMVVVPYLRSQQISQPDILMISHGDRDHSGGAASLLAIYPQLRVVTSATAMFPGADACRSGSHWRWDGVDFTLLNLPLSAATASSNDRSCVLRVAAAGGSVLLTGDIEKGTEARLVEADGLALASDIIVAPHHGSATSSSAAFVKAVNPHFVLFPVGYLNQWHFPRPIVQARYRHTGAMLLNTAACGAIRLRIGQPVRLVSAWRADQQRLWTRRGKTPCYRR